MSKENIWLTADWHITVGVPQGRVETEEEWMEVQRDSIRQVAKLVGDDLLVIIGDIIHNYKPKGSHTILNMLAKELPKNTVWLLGNHEFLMSGGDFDFIMKKGTAGTMVHMKGLKYLPDDTVYQWGDFDLYPFNFKHEKSIDHKETSPDRISVALGHFLSFNKQLPHWAKDGEAWLIQDILKEYKEYDLIAVGDNHETMIVDDKFISPGSLTRRTIRQDTHKPCIHKYSKSCIETVYLKVKPPEECITKEHKIKKDARTERIEQLGEDLKHKEDLTGDFKVDLIQHFVEEKVKMPVQDMLNKFIVEIENEK